MTCAERYEQLIQVLRFKMAPASLQSYPRSSESLIEPVVTLIIGQLMHIYQSAGISSVVCLKFMEFSYLNVLHIRRKSGAKFSLETH